MTIDINKSIDIELEAKLIKFVLLTTRYVNWLNYLCCFFTEPHR